MCHHAVRFELDDSLDGLLRCHFENLEREGQRVKICCNYFLCPIFTKARLEQLLKAAKYLLNGGHTPDEMGKSFLPSFRQVNPLNDTVFYVLRALLRAGANLDHPFRSSGFRNEIGGLLPPERMIRLLLPDLEAGELCLPGGSPEVNSPLRDNQDDQNFWFEQDGTSDRDLWSEQDDESGQGE